MGQCPTCGHDLQDDRFIVDLETNRVHYQGRIFQSTNKECLLIYHLYQKHPRVARRQELIFEIWGEHDEKKDENSLRGLVAMARVLGKVVGFAIESVPTVGYRIVLSGDPVINIIETRPSVTSRRKELM